MFFDLFLILVVGLSVGRVSVGGFSLGSAGVLLTSLAAGNFGREIPAGLKDFGLLLFAYSVGLQAGPRFFGSLRSSGLKLLWIGLAPTVAAFAATVALARLLSLDAATTVGLFSGALTNTSALAAGLDGLDGSGNASAAYAVTYPLATLSVIGLVQVLPRVTGRDVRAAAREWEARRQRENPPLIVRQYSVSNPNLFGKTVRELGESLQRSVSVSRVEREGRTLQAEPDLAFGPGDLVTVVGREDAARGLSMIFGEEAASFRGPDDSLQVTDVEISEPAFTGKSLGDLRVYERHKVLVTRIRHEGLEFLAGPRSVLGLGDTVRVVGRAEEATAFARAAGARPELVNETAMLPFLSGLLLGVAVGSIPVVLPGDVSISLGPAGGAFVTSLVLGHVGSVGPVRLFVPRAARNLCRELGLTLFLAGAGTSAGKGLWTFIAREGAGLVGAGLMVTAVAEGVALLVCLRVLRTDILESLGSLCGTMNNASGLSAVDPGVTREPASVAYASVYPVSLIAKIVAAQILVLTLG